VRRAEHDWDFFYQHVAIKIAQLLALMPQ